MVSIWDINFNEIHRVLIDNSYFSSFFPFLLMYALLAATLPKIHVFKDKKTGEPLNYVVAPIALVMSIVGVTFEISEGYTLGKLMMLMFPNISAITIGILCLYIIGGMFGKNFFKEMFRKDVAAFSYFAIGFIGVGTVIFYVGIALGFWDLNPFDKEAQFSIIFAVTALVLGVVFWVIRIYPYAFIMLFIFGTYIANYKTTSYFEVIFDPIIFILIIITIILSWMNSKQDEIKHHAREIDSKTKSLEKYGPDETSLMKDITSQLIERNKEEFKRLTGEDYVPIRHRAPIVNSKNQNNSNSSNSEKSSE